MERNTQPSNVRAEAGLSFYLRKAAVKYPGTVSIAVLDNRPDTVPLHIKSLRPDLPMVR
jgi:hypothetical protein